MKKLLKWIGIIAIWDYFKDSWEGEDRRASWKRMTLMVLTIKMIFYTDQVHDQWTFYVFCIYAGLITIMMGVLNWTQITTLLKFTLPLRKLGILPDTPPTEKTETPAAE